MRPWKIPLCFGHLGKKYRYLLYLLCIQTSEDVSIEFSSMELDA